MRAQSPIRAPLGTAAIVAVALSAAACGDYVSTGGPEHCGAVDSEIWGRDLNPHDVTCDVTVTGDLTIGPGTRIRFAPGTSLIVQGSLSIEGTEDRQVSMEPAEEGRGWVGIWVRGLGDEESAQRPDPSALTAAATQTRVSLTHVDIQSAGITPEGGAAFRPAALILDRGPVELSNVTLTDPRQCGMSLGENARLGANVEDFTITGSLEAPICAHVQAIDSLPSEGITLDEGSNIDIFGERLSGRNTWRNLGATYRITESFQLSEGELTVEAGNDLALFADTRLTFGGAVPANSYGEKPRSAANGPLLRDTSAVIHFAGTASDPIEVDVVPTNGEGSRWDRIALVGTSSNSASASATFSHVTFRNGGGGGDSEPAAVQIRGDIDVTMTDVTVQDGRGAGLLLTEGATVGAESSNLTITGHDYPVVTHPDGAFTLPSTGSSYTGNGTEPSSGLLRDVGDLIYLTDEGISDSGELLDLGVPYRLDGDLIAGGGPDKTLGFADGVEMQVPGNAEIRFGTVGALDLNLGTDGGAGVSFVPVDEAARWESLTFGSALSDTSSLNSVSVLGAGRAGAGAAVSFEATDLLVDGLTIDGTADDVVGLRLTGAFAEDSSGLVVRNAAGPAVVATTNAVQSLPKPGVELTANGDFSYVELDGFRVEVGGTWSNLGVPYRVASLITISGRELGDGSPVAARVIVDPGVTFDIEPRSGISVKAFQSSTDAEAYGTLVLDGTADEPITLRGTDPEQGWANLDFNDDNALPEAERSLLDHVIIEDAGAIFAQASLEFWDASPPASNVTIRNGFRYGVATLGDAYITPLPRFPRPPESVCDVWDRSAYTFDGVGKAIEPVPDDPEHIEFRVFIEDCP